VSSLRDPLWSVYFKAAGLRRSVVPPRLRPIQAEQALDHLLAHQDEHGGARRRRALFALGGSQVHKNERPTVTERVKDLAHDLRVNTTDLDVLGKRAGLDAALQVAPKGVECVAVNVTGIKVAYDPRTLRSTMDSTVLVNRSIGEMPRLVYPRNWKYCSDFFQESEPVDPRTDEPLDRVNLGGRWQLREVFEVPVAKFTNILNIEFDVQQNRIDMEYSLYDSLSFTFLGVELPGVLEVDSGFARVRPTAQAGWTEMAVRKTVSFRDLTPDYPASGGIDQGQWLNYCAPAMLGLWVDEMSQGRLCCRHPLPDVR